MPAETPPGSLPGALASMMPPACPEPRECDCPRGFDAVVQLTPNTPDTVTELEMRYGILNQPGGGRCGVMRGRSVRESDGMSSEWVELLQPPGCVEVPEPPAYASMLVGLLGVLVLAGFRRPKRKKAPTGRGTGRGLSGYVMF